MPEATPELRAQMDEYFGSPVDCAPPISYLRSRGFELRRDWHWEATDEVGEITDKDLACIEFLFQEWDFGGLLSPKDLSHAR